MAEVLKREYDLLVLKVGLDVEAPEPVATLTLEGKVEGELRELGRWTIPAQDLGLPAKLKRSSCVGVGYEFSVPDQVLQQLAAENRERNHGADPLWLHLARPYGYLGLVPWERLLVGALETPILRLPDFIAFPTGDPTDDLDILLCASLPVAKLPFPVVDMLERLAQRVLEALEGRARLHVFVDAEIWPETEDRLRQLDGADRRIEIYDPVTAEQYSGVEASTRIPSRAETLENPWLLWMRDRLAGRSLDVAHFLCHGFLAGSRGALSVAETPLQNQDRRMARFIGAAELTSFLTQTGAWATVLSSPPENYSEMGLRLLADTIAQIRPGPVLHQEMRLDPGDEVLADSYRLLFTGAARAPTSGAAITYCHPSLLQPDQPLDHDTFSSEVASEYRPSLPRGSDVGAPWMDSAQRYLEQQSLEVDRLLRAGTSSTEGPMPSTSRRAAVMQDTIRQMYRVIATHPSSKEEK